MKRLFDGFKELRPDQKGALAGFFVALILAIFGFWKFILILVLTLAGYFIGKEIFANKEVLKEFLDKILPPGKFR